MVTPGMPVDIGFDTPPGVWLNILWVDDNTITFDISVEPGLRSQGLGTDTMWELVMVLDELGFGARIRAARPSLVRWYEQFGFVVCGPNRLMERV